MEQKYKDKIDAQNTITKMMKIGETEVSIIHTIIERYGFGIRFVKDRINHILEWTGTNSIKEFAEEEARKKKKVTEVIKKELKRKGVKK